MSLHVTVFNLHFYGLKYLERSLNVKCYKYTVFDKKGTAYTCSYKTNQ